MRYKVKSILALDIILGALPDKMRVEVDRGIGVSAKSVGDPLPRIASALQWDHCHFGAASSVS
jgi:hypothetical protein